LLEQKAQHFWLSGDVGLRGGPGLGSPPELPDIRRDGKKSIAQNGSKSGFFGGKKDIFGLKSETTNKKSRS